MSTNAEGSQPSPRPLSRAAMERHDSKNISMPHIPTLSRVESGSPAALGTRKGAAASPVLRRSPVKSHMASASSLRSTGSLGSSASQSALLKPHLLDHLGRSLDPHQRIKFKTGLRTCALVYDRRVEEAENAERVWKLLQETIIVMDSSLEGLRHLFELPLRCGIGLCPARAVRNRSKKELPGGRRKIRDPRDNALQF